MTNSNWLLTILVNIIAMNEIYGFYVGRRIGMESFPSSVISNGHPILRAAPDESDSEDSISYVGLPILRASDETLEMAGSSDSSESDSRENREKSPEESVETIDSPENPNSNGPVMLRKRPKYLNIESDQGRNRMGTIELEDPGKETEEALDFIGIKVKKPAKSSETRPKDYDENLRMENNDGGFAKDLKTLVKLLASQYDEKQTMVQIVPIIKAVERTNKVIVKDIDRKVNLMYVNVA